MKFIAQFFKDLFRPEEHRPIYIFDLDGTLSDADHRERYIKGEFKDWEMYFRASCRDKLHHHVIIALRATLDYGCDVRIWTGRSVEVYDLTVSWLSQALRLPPDAIRKMLKMRAADDRTPDYDMKRRWLLELPPDEYMRIMAVYEDRASVVKMWRENGIPCFQVAPGEF